MVIEFSGPLAVPFIPGRSQQLIVPQLKRTSWMVRLKIGLDYKSTSPTPTADVNSFQQGWITGRQHRSRLEPNTFWSEGGPGLHNTALFGRALTRERKNCTCYTYHSRGTTVTTVRAVCSCRHEGYVKRDITETNLMYFHLIED